VRVIGTAVLGAACVLAMASAGCGSHRLRSAEKERVFKATGVAFLEETDREPGVPAGDWDTVVEATGEGLPAADAATPAMKKLTALEAAKYLALARLTEKIRGTHVRLASKVRDMKFVAQEVEAGVSGDIQGVRIVRSDYDEQKEIAHVTVMVGLDSEGNIVPDRLLPITPLSEAARRARAESAARLDAMAKLREQIGEVYVGQEVKVKNLMLSHQRAWLLVEGILEGVKFSEPLWPTDRQCKVEATLVVSDSDLERLMAVTRPTR